MPFIELNRGRMWFEEAGSGRPLVCLHSGWGRKVMPFDDAGEVLGSRYRLLFPDRFGYGRSDPVDHLPPDYHARAAEDLLELLDRLGLDSPVVWGHSDGAVIGSLLAAAQPDRVAALILEATHFHRAKSLESFATNVGDPGALANHVKERLLADHGERWPEVVRMHSQAWLDFHSLGGDFYQGCLAAISCPTLLLHGAGDPHTPVSEVEEIARRIPGAVLQVFAEGRHSPHSESATARACSEQIEKFLRQHGL